VNVSNPLTIFSSDAVQTCDVRPNLAATIVLVNSAGSPSFTGTFPLYISNEQREGQFPVSCRVTAADGMAPTNETTYTVLGNFIIL
jgi:hypothetical protein